ncbi:MAG: hypothetical protein IT238_04885 [Bacteroidia bacterium]|nr:hypothetical protein [Bacteroidia bacterium]MCZ2248369.1 hypothetical protein [Bacteroidia bacterium]
MIIDLHNYEIVLIDYFDGNLSPDEVGEVLVFLEQHPEIKNAYEGLSKLPIVSRSEKLESNFKNQLKRDVSERVIPANIDEMLIAQMEHDISHKDNEELTKLAQQYTEIAKLKNIFALTKLSPDLSVQFPDKESLKKKGSKVIYMPFLRYAAAILLLFSFGYFTRNYLYQINNDGQEQKVAVINNNSRPESETIASTNNNTNDGLEVHQEITHNTQNTVANTNEKQPKINKILKYDLHSVAKKNSSAAQAPELSPDDEISHKQPIHQEIVNQIAQENKTTNHEGVVRNEIDNISTNPNVFTQVPPIVRNHNEYMGVQEWITEKIIAQSKKNLYEEGGQQSDSVSRNIELINIAALGAGLIEKATSTEVEIRKSQNNKTKIFSFALGKFKYENIKRLN